ncbi:hypothetical protein ASPWEDRAFT_173101 [Aspergillus wentii DTO 134E9]|uniref:O-methylsterigmatocystin oxidoreductase n=1 Tax=Aspergillus wentii DTO 134E9 TaxID=1073089 RepID=A0A1L9RFL2_ASPWE|nr:uncharacterized protein ASPWEDRAFT_173101 [Aspergillus wentii DTO 134E9]OJJ33663.1 hypothetical protein ASPWEDRAFT_173101 [Aspergillus wentii DTO 134E9]
MAFLLCLLIIISIYLYKSSKSKSPTPYPAGLPIIGNTLQLTSQPHRQFIQWARQYGEIYRVRLGLMDWYMLNSPEAIKEILDKQSSVTSSRAPMPAAQEALSGGMRFVFMAYGPEWRKLRSVSHKLLTPRMSDTFRPSQDFEAKQLLFDLLVDNAGEREFYMHVRRYTTSVMMTSTYGRRIPTWECDDVREVYAVMKDFSEASVPGQYIVDVIPWLADILPKQLHWWQRSIRLLREKQDALWMKLWSGLRTKMESGNAPECFVKQFIESDYENMGISELQAAFLAGTMIEAGSETTSSALNSCILYLSAYPDIQRRAQDEIDQVVGSIRSPSFSDIEHLPYIRAIVKEVFRMRPPTNMGIPHYTTADITYKQHTIPKNSMIIMQQYPLHYDPSLFPDPETFKPERYLNHPHGSGVYATMADPYERDHWSFGAGRRICVGIHLAENSLFITIAKILWAFNIVAAEKVDLSDDAYEPGMMTIPKPFSVRFESRSAEVEEVVRGEWELAEREGYTLRDRKVDAMGIVV